MIINLTGNPYVIILVLFMRDVLKLYEVMKILQLKSTALFF